MAESNTFYPGKELRIKVGGKAMFHSTSCGISISTTLEAIATKDTSGTINTPGNYEWTLTAETLIVNKALVGTSVDTSDLLDMQLAGQEIEIDFTTGRDGDIMLSGKAYIESTGLKADNGSNSTVSYSFKGNGDLVKTKFKKV